MFFLTDLTLWNKSLSQRWRRLRRRCSSFTTGSSVSTYIANQKQHKESLLDLETSCDTPVMTARRNSSSVVITPRRAMSPSKDGLCHKHDSISMDETFISKPPKSKSATEKIFPEVQQLLRTKLNRIHAGLRKRRAVSVHEVQTNRSQQPIFYVPSPLATSASHHDSIHDIGEHEDDGSQDGPDDHDHDAHDVRDVRESGHVSLPPFAFRDANTSPEKTKDLSRKPSSVCSSGRGTGTPTEDMDRRSTDSNRSSTCSGRDHDPGPHSPWNKDHGYHSIESQNINYERVYCDKWSSVIKDSKTLNSSDKLNRTKEQYDFIQASERRNSVKFAVNEPVRQIETSTSPNKFFKDRYSDHPPLYPRTTTGHPKFNEREAPKNSFMIGSLVTNRFIACSTLPTDSGPPSLPYGVSTPLSSFEPTTSPPRRQGGKTLERIPSSKLENLPPRGNHTPSRSNPPLPLSTRNRTRSQSPTKKDKKHLLRSVWTSETKSKSSQTNPVSSQSERTWKTGENREVSEIRYCSSPAEGRHIEKSVRFYSNHFGETRSIKPRTYHKFLS